MAEGSRESEDFARAFGNALEKFLREREITQTQASERLGLGKYGNARLSAYCHDSPKGKRPSPDAEILYRVCTELGFEFDYKGYRITAESLNGSRPESIGKAAEQLRLEFSGQFNLTDQEGTVSVTFNRPPRRVDLSVRLKAAS